MRIFFALLMLLSVLWAQETYDEFLQNEQESLKEAQVKEQEDFKNYIKETNREFEEYKKVFMEEFNKFKSDVAKHWDSVEYTDRKKWVEYSKDYNTKKVFNFENGKLRIEVSGKVNNPQERIKKELKDFLTEDKKEAFRRDPVARNVEEKIRNKFKNAKTGSIEKNPILAPIVLGKSTLKKSELQEGINRLLKKGKILTKKTKKGEVIVFTVNIPPGHVLKKAKQYKPIVIKEAKKRKVSPALVFAIIHTESYFNPMARSWVPAYGLMQIVPNTAGKDASTIIYGKPVVLSPSYLYNAENNIKIGTAFLYLLYYKYFKDVHDPESRLYCTIAAYNTGVGNVAYAFTKSTNLKKAIGYINKMKPKEVYEALIRNLPSSETRDYLKKVTSRIIIYKNL